MAEAYVSSAKGRMKTFVQVGHNSLKASAELAGHAESIGADAVSATPTGYFKVSGEEALVEGLLPIVEAAPKTPFYYYHIPFLSGVNLGSNEADGSGDGSLADVLRDQIFRWSVALQFAAFGKSRAGIGVFGGFG